MIKAQEHFYADDPAVGPPDVRTVLKDCSYFFLGNGLIQAAVQFSPAGEGTPLGLLVMDPDCLGKKRDALTMDAEHGLRPTMVEIEADGRVFRPEPAELSVRWDEVRWGPVVRAEWTGAGIRVVEQFFCPDMSRALLSRVIIVSSDRPAPVEAVVRTGFGAEAIEKRVTLGGGRIAHLAWGYELDAARRRVRTGFLEDRPPSGDAAAFWTSLARVSFGHPLLDHFFRSAKFQLPAIVSRSGALDGSVWQYNREWLRDQSVVATALAMIGATDAARTMVERLAGRFVTTEGDTVDSSERRDPDEVELDQNGYFLLGLKNYALWTGDEAIARRFWPKISAAAEFPLRDVFRHPASGLLMNRREYWERHRIHGIETGLELAHQVFAACGLEAAATLARWAGKPDAAGRWEGESRRIKRALLEDRTFRMADNRGFLKRRAPDGRVQETITPLPEAELPEGVPLRSERSHSLNPDTSAALPIALGLVPAASPLTALTLTSLETLWDQAWEGGGYGRYHFSSEPDSAGPWPFASLFVARAYVEAGRPAEAWRVLSWMNSRPGAAAGSWFEFYGPRKSPPFPQVGIIPWTWAEIVLLLVHHILGVRPEENGLRIRPRFLPGMGPGRAELPLRGSRLILDWETAEAGRKLRFESDAAVLEARDGAVLLEPPKRDIHVRVY